MTLENFQTLITNKIFISIESVNDLADFTSLEQIGVNLRNAATTAKVIVFLPAINTIFARGSYYGISDTKLSELQSTLTNLSGTVTTLGGSLADLTALVHTQGNTITGHTTNINGLKTLIGSNLDSNDQQIITNANGIIGEIVSLKASVAALSPSGTDLSTLVDQRIEATLSSQLETALGSSATISGLTTSIGNINQALADKAEKDEFDEVVEKLGIETWTWDESSQNNITIVDQLNSLTQNVSQIPHFGIQIVDANNNGLPDVAQNQISKTTIYLVRSGNAGDPSNNEIFVEYIYVNLDKGKTDPETGDPLPERWGWESLGRQYFNVTNYLDKNAIQQITDALETQINAIQTQLGNADTSQIATNKTNIETLQTNLQTLQNNIDNILDSNGNFLLTGEDIKTTAAGNSTIASDIAALQSNKLDKVDLEWVIVTNE